MKQNPFLVSSGMGRCYDTGVPGKGNRKPKKTGRKERQEAHGTETKEGNGMLIIIF